MVSEQPSNQWIDRIRNHAVHQTLANAFRALEPAETRATDDYAAVIAVSRVRSLLQRAFDAVADCDPFTTPTTMLDAANGQISSATNELSDYASNGSIQHLLNANGQLDTITLPLSSIAVSSVGDGTVAAAMTAFHQAVDRHLSGIRTDADAARASLDGVRAQMTAFETEITNQKARIDGVIALFQQQGSSAEADRTAHFGQSELNRQNQAAASEETRRVAYVSASDERRAAFEVALSDAKRAFADLEAAHQEAEDERSTTFTSMIDAHKSEGDQLAVELRSAARVVITQIEGEKVKAEKLVNAIADTGMVSGYQTNANSERTSALVWSTVTVIAMLALVAGSIVLLVETPETFSWTYLPGRILFTTALVILASYAGKQAALHRDEARSLRRTQLEIASIDPYLALSPEADRNAVKRLLAERMFAQPARSTNAEQASSAGDAADLLKATLDTAKSGFDALKGVIEKK